MAYFLAAKRVRLCPRILPSVAPYLGEAITRKRCKVSPLGAICSILPFLEDMRV